jgi:hypothetical protein
MENEEACILAGCRKHFDINYEDIIKRTREMNEKEMKNTLDNSGNDFYKIEEKKEVELSNNSQDFDFYAYRGDNFGVKPDVHVFTYITPEEQKQIFEKTQSPDPEAILPPEVVDKGDDMRKILDCWHKIYSKEEVVECKTVVKNKPCSGILFVYLHEKAEWGATTPDDWGKRAEKWKKFLALQLPENISLVVLPTPGDAHTEFMQLK